MVCRRRVPTASLTWWRQPELRGETVAETVARRELRGEKMAQTKHRYLVNEKGRKTAVLLPIKEYQELLEDLHDLAIMVERKDEPSEPWEAVKQRLEAGQK